MSGQQYNPGNPDHYAVSVIKGLVIDGVKKANSGHPGGAMSSADFAYILHRDFLNYDPDNAEWLNRDRFILSAGHESMLLYTLLVLQGRMKLEDLQQFRQWGSRTPGHPEAETDLGIECTTGPLGQGVAMGAGFAIAEAVLQHQLGKDVCDHYTYILAGDGDLQEPVAIGASATAAHLGLGKIILFYDRNAIQISGSISRADSTDVNKLFESIGWHVVEIDGHNHDAIRTAIKNAQAETGRPSIIIGHTTMAKGAATLEGDHETHGAPLPDDEIIATKKKLGLPEDQTFHLPEATLNHFRGRWDEMRANVKAWNENLEKRKSDAKFKELWSVVHDGKLPANFMKTNFGPGDDLATRTAFGKVLADLADTLPNIVGGSADLEPSNETKGFFKKVGDFTKSDRSGRNIAFGVKEFPMGAIVNGIALHGGLKSFGATFLVFSDYERGAIRLSALQNVPVLHVFTHDSFYLGEDGPTHQPIEHLASLRAIPNLLVFRPCDASETAASMEAAFEQTKRPSTIILTRQKLKNIDRSNEEANVNNLKKGAYIAKGSAKETPDIVIIATGSEVELALGIADKLSGKKVRVVSMPCMELFEEQSESYRESIIPSSVENRVTLEAGSTYGWHKYAGSKGFVFGIDRFGASAPAGILAKEFGFTVDHLAAEIQKRFQ